MTTKSLKKFAELLNRSEGISIAPIIVIMVIMSVMGGVFTSIMGSWKVSAPLTVNSNKAFFLAETAAMFALQDAQYRFYSKDSVGIDLFNFGTSTAVPYVVSSVTTGSITNEADYWFERPGGAYINDDGSSDANDDNVDDDDDDITNPTRYSIVATGTVTIDGATLAKRQIKILADINPSTLDTIIPGVQTSVLGSGGGIQGTAAGFGISFGGTVTYDNVGLNSTPDAEAGIVIRPAQVLETFDEHFVKALATDQGNFNAADLIIDFGNDDYPTASYYYHFPTRMPNFTYVEQDLTVGASFNANGVIWVKGNVTLTSSDTMNAIIICEGNIDFGIGNASNIDGGVILLGDGVITGNDNAAAIVVNQAYYDDLNAIVPDITVISWNEAVSAN